MQTTVSLILRQEQQALAGRIVDLQYARQPEVWKPYGHPGREKSVRDSGYHLLYLAEALEAGNPDLFIQYVAWVKTLFVGLNFPGNVLPTTLECTQQALMERLPVEQRGEVLAMLGQALHSLGTVNTELPSFLDEDNALGRQFLGTLLQGNRLAASQLILKAVEAGMPVQDVYLQVFQPTQREVGRLWQTNQISVAQEHFCTAVTQMVMSLLYPYIFNGERKARSMVMACVGGELHEIGARMVADFFEMEGWDTYFLGANTPLTGILRCVGERKADVLALSATMTFHVSAVREIIQGLRANESLRTKVLVGGYPFNISPGLWEQVGADGFAVDARAAVAEAERLVGSGF